VEEPPAADLHEAALGGREGGEPGDGVGMPCGRERNAPVMTAESTMLEKCPATGQ
jgi:hypothetical protein